MFVYIVLALAACTICVLVTLLVVQRRRRITELLSPIQESSVGVRESLSLSRTARAIQIKDSLNRDILELRLPEANMNPETWKPIQLKTIDRGWLEPLIAEALKTFDLPLLAGFRSSQTFEVVFHGEGHLMKAADRDGFRAMLVGKNNKIIEHARLHEAANLIRFDLLWECAAIITQRKFLADIDKKLKLIDVGISDLKSYLRNERVAKLQASCLSLIEAAIAVKNDPSALFRQDFLRHAVEDAEREASKIVRACLLDLQSGKLTIQETSLHSLMSVDLGPILRQVEAAVFSIKIAAFSLDIRNFAASLAANYLDDSEVRLSRSQDVIRLYKELNSESVELQRVFRERIDDMKEKLSFKQTITEKQNVAKSKAEELFKGAVQMLKKAKLDCEAVASDQLLVPAAKSPIHLQIRVNRAGKFIEASVAPRD